MIALIFLLAAEALAGETQSTVTLPKEEKRASSIGLTYQFADDDFTSWNLKGSLGITPKWALLAKVYRSIDELGLGLTEIEVGADTNLSLSWSFYLSALYRADANGLNAGGLKTGAGWIVSDLWDADLMTQISLDLEFYRHQQSTTVSSKKKSVTLTSSILQSGATLSISQEITETIGASVGFTAYGYSQDPSTLSESVLFRKFTSSNLQGLVSGFPKSAWSLDAYWNFLPHWTARVGYSDVLLATDSTHTYAITGGADWNITQNWRASAEITRSTTSSEATQLFGLGVGYSW